ncbi:MULTISPECIES: S8 family peptidase [unclassified Tolypothrix]|uniref:S8 family peptidase n=1 Tax=unclassified Tolypothrix TaxID=2649714 RepID=UPI0005EAA3EB|nr:MULTISPECIES: S8 family serine peptidase [unclassified Tolypothrix]BAY95292.1 peptidase S8/S53 [Microchaete diplosiphon NIES-3275]EKE98295.1 peptidase families S8 and S53 [Tolypothrix sp. PCC 7601]MBE9084011.1 S8 family serine peptidase [Tolypothrix sp. LEGE 11397]UYD30515.1 S8 family serine peptidase [Tolypothrix sp. PCC 7712]UYD38352.1 S8 family serine peptidase [Tolypothrix sp. PCC 7601]
MKRLLSSVVLTSYILGIASVAILPLQRQVTAQVQKNNELFYTFYGQKIPLSVRQDTVAVAFKPVRTRGKALFQQLQDDLRSGRGGVRDLSQSSGVNVEVNPLGANFALVKLPTSTRNSVTNLQQLIQKQPYVQETLPVLTRTTGDSNSGSKQQTIVLPNEIIVNFEPGLSDSQKQLILVRNNLEVVRQLRFSKNHYVVRPKSVSGTAVLSIANQLTDMAGIQSATPNFIQTTSYQTLAANSLTETPNAKANLQSLLATLPQPKDTPQTTSLLPLQWHLNSTPRRGQFLPRTDIRATEAWKNSNGGRDVVVAVIDSVIQWDHPDLAKNLYNSGNSPDKLPNEQYGWDFSSGKEGDADTRLGSDELATVQAHFQNTFVLSSEELLKKYASLAEALKQRFPNASSGQIVLYIKNYIRNEIAAEFHGTWSAGVIAANSEDKSGVLGVAPHAKILPVRVFGLGGKIDSASLIEAIGYSNARGADIINMSLGGLLPDEGLTEQIFDVLDNNPKLVIVASAGNENLDGVSFPAAIPGVISVGATNVVGNRTAYSSYGGGLQVVAPGGDLTNAASGGILTTGGTFLDGFWQGMKVPDYAWGVALDPLGKYVQVQGTSFSAPVVSGVVALMKGEDGQRRLNREGIVKILKSTASYNGLTLSKGDINRYRLQADVGFGAAGDFPYVRPSGVFGKAKPVSAEQYYFGSGLINAEAAVAQVKR